MNSITNDPRTPLNFNLSDYTKVAIATTVYIIDGDKVLLLKQTKPHTVVPDVWVGIGGKTPVKTYLSNSDEKNNHQIITTSLLNGEFELPEPLEKVAAREVHEETGLKIDSEKLENIGFSQVRLLNSKTDEFWIMKNYIYYANGTEGQLSDCNEGTLQFVPISKISQISMHPHDKIILREKDSSTSVQSVIDDIHSEYKLRITKEKGEQKIYILLPAFNTKPTSVRGVITRQTASVDYVKSLLPVKLSELSTVPEQQLVQLLRSYGIGEEAQQFFYDIRELPEDWQIDLD